MTQNLTLPMLDTKLAGRMADAIRMLAVDAEQQANSGPPGAPMGMAEIKRFGQSAPGPELMRHFGCTAVAVMAALRQRVTMASRTA